MTTVDTSDQKTPEKKIVNPLIIQGKRNRTVSQKKNKNYTDTIFDTDSLSSNSRTKTIDSLSFRLEDEEPEKNRKPKIQPTTPKFKTEIKEESKYNKRRLKQFDDS